MKKCCICERIIENEDAPVLAMGAVGNPKLLCDECAGLLDDATMSREIEKIEGSMEEISRRMSDGNPDRVTFNIVSQLMAKAAARGKAIKQGQYDFALDEQVEEDEEAMEEIPEELLETEEDRELDRKDEEKMKKFDKFYNGMLIGAGIGFLGVLIWKLVERFFL